MKRAYTWPTEFWTSHALVPRSEWGPGPWENEPDKLQWKDAETGYPCLVVRAPNSGALCGYVGVDRAHPLYGFDFEQVSDALAEVADDVEPGWWPHGSINFASPCAHGDDERYGVCHVPEPGEPDDVWWFGFDCAHNMDYPPQIAARIARVKDMAENELNLSPFPEVLPWPYDHLKALRTPMSDVYKPLRYVEVEVTKLAKALMLSASATHGNMAAGFTEPDQGGAHEEAQAGGDRG